MRNAYHVPRGIYPLCHYVYLKISTFLQQLYVYSNVKGPAVVSVFSLDLSFHYVLSQVSAHIIQEPCGSFSCTFLAVPNITNLVQDLFISHLNYYSFPISLFKNPSFIEQMLVYSKIGRKVQRFPIYLCPNTGIASSVINITPQTVHFFFFSPRISLH